MWLMGVLAVTVEDALITYGPLGIGVLVLGLFAAQQVKYLRDRADKSDAQNEELVRTVFEKVLPSLARNTEVLEKRGELDREMIEALRDSAEAIRSLDRPAPRRRAT